MILYLLLFILAAFFSHIWCLRENLTLEQVNKKVNTLNKKVKKIDTDLKDQETRMGAASTQAAQSQALLHSNVKT